jgi:hypothetical protein
MTRHQGTEQVESGLYLNLKHLSFKPLSERGPLPGSRADVYYRVPLIVMFLAAPLLGLAYVIFLPVLGFAMVGYLLGGLGLKLAGQAAGQAARVVRPGWEPSLAFFSRHKTNKAIDVAATPADETTTTAVQVRDEWAESVERKLNDK